MSINGTNSSQRYSSRWTSRNPEPPLLPLDRAGGFGGDVVNDAVDAAHLVDDARRGMAEAQIRSAFRRLRDNRGR